MLTSAISQTTFQIRPGAKEIGKEDILQVEYAVKGSTNASNFEEPLFPGWKVLSGPSVSSQQISINGKTESSVSYIYSLQPKMTGNLIIPATSIYVDNKIMKCSPVSIKIKNTAHVAGANSSTVNGLQLPGGFFKEDNLAEDEIDKASILQPGESVASKIKNNLFVKAIVNKTSCVIGEPILVTYKLFTRLHSQTKVAKQPAFNGCTVYEMTTDELAPEIEKYQGKDYKTYVIRKVQLFPLETGTITLDVASVDNEISLYKKGANGFPETVTQNITVSSEPLVLHVNPLPEKGKPADGNGTIGNFSINALVEKLTDTAGDNNNLIINISGDGNFQSINCPNVLWPSNSEHFDITEKSSINKLIFPASGTKTFIIPFLAKQAGKLVIPPIQFTYFDINTRQYKTAKSDSIEVTVLPALKTRYDITKLSPDITNHKYIWIVPFIALLAGVGWWLQYGRKRNQEFAAPGKSASITQKAEKLPDTEPVVIAPEPIVITSAEKLNELLTVENERDFYAQAKQLATDLQEENEYDKKELETIIRQCNEALYMPLTAVSKEEIFKSLEKTLVGRGGELE